MSERNFFYKLFAAIAVKLLLLAGLWFFFVKDSLVRIDTVHMASHIHDNQL